MVKRYVVKGDAVVKLLLHSCLICVALIPREAMAGLLTGGVFIERCRGARPCEAIMTAPFFSQTKLEVLGLCEVKSDPAVVHEAMNKLLDSTELASVRAVLARPQPP